MDFSESSHYGAFYLLPSNEQFFIDTSLETRFAFSIRPKIGYSFGDTMVHFAAGPAVNRFKYKSRYSNTTFSLVDTTSSDTRTVPGGSANIGINHMLGDGWSLRGDYVLNDFPKAVDTTSTFTEETVFSSGFKHEVDFISQSFRLGLAKQF